MRRRGVALALVLPLLVSCTARSQDPLRRAAPEARSGGVLRVGIPTPGSVDPGNVYEPSGDLVTRTLCTPLLAADPETRELLPSIVESWLVTDGGAGLTLRLRKGLRFSDGAPVGAEDVVFTLNRIASAEYASTSAERLSPIQGYPEIHGDIATDNDTARRLLSGAVIRDGLTVQLSLRTPQADFLRLLTSPLTAPVSKAAAEANPRDFGRQPVCVGPYRLASPYTAGATAVKLVRSEAYDAPDMSLTAGGRAYPDAIEFLFYADGEAARAALDAREVDVAPARPTDRDGVKAGPGPEVEYIGLPAAAPGFDDPAIRRALSLALDREALIRAVFPGTRRPAGGFLPPTSPAPDECPSAPPRGDVPGAKALLARAGADLSQLRTALYFNDEFRHRAVAEEVARQWRESVGLIATPTPLQFAEYLARGEGRPGFDGPFRFSWSSPFSDVDGYLFPLFSTDRIGRDNFTRFSDPALDAALTRRARRAQDPADRTIAYREVTDRLCDAMPMIPLTSSLSRWSVAGHVGSASGSYLDGATGQPLVRELYLR